MTTVAGIGEEFRPDARRKVGLPPDVVKRLTKLNPIKSTLGVFETIGLIVISLAAALYWWTCLLYTSPSPRDATLSRMPSSA